MLTTIKVCAYYAANIHQKKQAKQAKKIQTVYQSWMHICFVNIREQV